MMKTGSFFGRRKGRPLRPHQRSLFDSLWPHLALDLRRDPPTDIKQLFNAPIDCVHLEIGFGGGERLCQAALRCPQIGFLGVEPFINGAAKLLTQIEAHPTLIKNIRLYDEDATQLLDWLPPAVLSEIDLFYPDPWQKKKHWKRRFVNKTNLDRFARVLKSGARFRFASDIASYVSWTIEHCQAHEAFNLISNGNGWNTPYPDWHPTRYEAKALREGRPPAYLTFQRI